MSTSDITPTVVLIHTADHAIHPHAERDMAKRAGSEITEIDASHAVPATHPAEVAAVIVRAVRAVT
jgi:pimeloyl-ACP methyl ester carboxylesterase